MLNKKKRITKECWNFNSELVKWLNEHLKVYKKQAGKNIDLTFHKFVVGKEIFTQEQIINRLIELTDYLIKNYDNWSLDPDIINSYKNEMYDLLKEVHWVMWW